jgi:alpha-mannosidase
MFGADNMFPVDPNRTFRLNSADLVVPNMDAWRVMWDFDSLHQLVNDLPGDSSLAKRAQNSANEMMNAFVEGDVTREVAERVLGHGWTEDIEKDSKAAENQHGTLWGVGHWYVLNSRIPLIPVISIQPGYGLSP